MLHPESQRKTKTKIKHRLPNTSYHYSNIYNFNRLMVFKMVNWIYLKLSVFVFCFCFVFCLFTRTKCYFYETNNKFKRETSSLPLCLTWLLVDLKSRHSKKATIAFCTRVGTFLIATDESGMYLGDTSTRCYVYFTGVGWS